MSAPALVLLTVSLFLFDPVVHTLHALNVNLVVLLLITVFYYYMFVKKARPFRRCFGACIRHQGLARYTRTTRILTQTLKETHNDIYCHCSTIACCLFAVFRSINVS